MKNLFKAIRKRVTLAVIILFSMATAGSAQTTQTFTSSGSWTCPYGVSSVTIETWGGGGAGGGCTNKAGGGGGGGAYTTSTISVTYGTTYNYIVGAGGIGADAVAGTAGGASSFNGTAIANGGAGGGVGTTTDGAGGTGGTGTRNGGNGGTAIYATGSGGGGGGAGTTANGGNGVALTAGTGGSTGGGNGAAGRSTNGDGTAASTTGSVYGGGGSGAKNTGGVKMGGNGAQGLVKITYTKTCLAPPAQPTSLVLTAAATSISGSFTAETYAEGYLVVRTTTSSAPTNPTNGTTYTAGTNALGGYIVYAGTATTFNATGLTGGTQYWFWVYGYNNVSCTPGIAYLTASPLSNTATAGAATIVQTYGTSTTWTCPYGVSSIKVECWGGGGAGGGTVAINKSGGGGAGGDYKLGASIAVTPGTTYTVTVGAGGAGSTGAGANGTASVFLSVSGSGGNGGGGGTSSGNGAKGAKGTSGTFGGGDGAAGTATASGGGGGGGGSLAAGTSAGAAPANGIGGNPDGGNGGAGVTTSSNGNNGNSLSGGGSGALSLNGTSYSGGNGGAGQVKLTYSNPCATPPAQPTSLSLAATTDIDGSFTAATHADGYLVIRTSTSTAPSAPVNGTTYTVGASALGGYVEQAGTGTTFTSTSLTANTTYWYWVYAYHNSSCTGGIVYRATSPLSASATTLAACTTPSAQPTALTFTPVYSERVHASFTAGTASGYLVVRTTTSSAPTNPVNGTTYTAGTTALGGYIESTGASTTFISTSLTANTQYWYWVYAYNNTSCSGIAYRTASPLSASVTTAAVGTWTNNATISTAGTATYNWSALSWSLGHLPTSSEHAQLVLNNPGTSVDAVTVTLDQDISVYSFTMTNQSPSTVYKHVFTAQGVINFTVATDMTITSPGGLKYNRSVFTNKGTTTVYGNTVLGRTGGAATDGHVTIGSYGTVPNQTFTFYGNLTFNPRAYITDEYTRFIFDKAGTQYIYNNTAVTDTAQPILFEQLIVGNANTTTLVFGGTTPDFYLDNVHATGVTVGANSTIDFPSNYSLTKFAGGTAQPFTLNSGSKLRLGGDKTIDRDGVVGGVTGSNFPANFTYSFNSNSTVEYYGCSGITQTIYNSPTYGKLSLMNGCGTGRAAKITTGSVGTQGGVSINALTDLTLGSTFTCQGSFDIISSGALDCSTYSLNGSGSFNLQGGGTVTTADAQGIYASGSNNGSIKLTGGRTYSSTASYVYKGTSAQVLGTGLPSTIKDLTIDNPTTVTASSDITVTGTTDLKQGTFDIGTTRYKITGTGTLGSTGGKMKANTGILEMAGSSGTAQSLSGSWFVGKNISTLMNSNTTGITLSATANDTLIVSSAVLYGTGTTNSTINTNDNLTLISRDSATARFGEIVAGSGNSITGKVNVERYVKSGRKWRLLSWPTTSTQTAKQSLMESSTANGNASPGYGTIVTDNGAAWSTNGFDAQSVSGPSLKYWDATSNAFVGIPNATTFQMNSQSAYFNYIRGDRSCLVSPVTVAATILRGKGTLKTGNQAFNIPANKTIPIGNPYASAVDLRLVDTTGLTSSFYVWDPNLTGTYGLGAYQTLYPSGTHYRIMPGGGSYGALNSIVDTLESGQAMFVAAKGSGGTITFKEAAKSRGARTQAREANLASSVSAYLSIKDPGVNTLADGAMVSFGDNYNAGLDYDDIKKLANTNENVSFKRSGSLFAIERRPFVTNNDTLFINLSGGRVHAYQWQIDLENMDNPGLTAFFKDNYTGTQTALDFGQSNTINVDLISNSGSLAADRFMIVFKQVNSVVPVHFTSISATRNTDKTVSVKWDVENEINMQSYAVEYSADGTHFNTIGSQSPTANNGGSAVYTFIDGHATAGTNYYRVKGISNNGQVQYTAIAKVGPITQTPSISIYPNPVTDNTLNLRFENQPKGTYTLKVTNMLGQSLLSENIELTNNNTVRMIPLGNNTAAGSYHATITDAAGKVTAIPFLIK